MKAVELGSKPDIFIADDLIKTAKELQTHLAGVPPDSQPETAAMAIETLGDPREIYGGRNVYIHSLGAFVLTRWKGLSEDEELYHGTFFGDAYFHGSFNRIAYIQYKAVRSLCLNLFKTEVIASSSDPSFEGETIRSGVYVPVHSVESVFAA